MSEKIPYVQTLDVYVTDAPLPCLSCRAPTVQKISVIWVNAIVGVIDFRYECQQCNGQWYGRSSIVEQASKFESCAEKPWLGICSYCQ